MKKTIFSLVAGLALALSASVALAASGAQEIPVTPAIRAAGTVTSADMYARKDDRGISVLSNVTSVTGSSTLTMIIQGKTPQGAYYDVLSMTGIQPSTSTVNQIQIAPGITATAGSSASVLLPPVFRVKGVLAGTGSATYSIGVNRTTN